MNTTSTDVCQHDAEWTPLHDLYGAYWSSVQSHWLHNYYSYPQQPEIISESTHQRITEAVHTILEALQVASRLAVARTLKWQGRDLLDQLEIPPHALYWIERHFDPLAELAWGRPDFHLVDGVPKLLEANFGGAAGYQQQVAGLCDYYLTHPQYWREFDLSRLQVINPLAEFLQYVRQRLSPGQMILLPDVFEDWRHPDRETRPYGGIVSWLNLRSDFRFRSCFLNELQFSADKVMLGREKVDAVFMSYYNPHVFTHFADFLPLWDIAERGGVVRLDSPAEYLWANKILLAYVSEFLDSLPLAADLKRRFSLYVPWTRIFRDGPTTFEGREVSLLELASSTKDRFVLKKAQSAEGKMVYIGRQIDPDTWNASLKRYAQTKDWILQEFIEPEQGQVVVANSDGVCTQQTVSKTISPYVTGRSVAGYLNCYYRWKKGEGSRDNASKQRLYTLGTTVIRTSGADTSAELH